MVLGVVTASRSRTLSPFFPGSRTATTRRRRPGLKSNTRTFLPDHSEIAHRIPDNTWRIEKLPGVIHRVVFGPQSSQGITMGTLEGVRWECRRSHFGIL